jgi:hypothetical protein
VRDLSNCLASSIVLTVFPAICMNYEIAYGTRAISTVITFCRTVKKDIFDNIKC